MFTTLRDTFGEVSSIIEEYLPDDHYRWMVRRYEAEHEGRCKNKRCFQCFNGASRSKIYHHDGTWDDLALNEEGLSAETYLQVCDLAARRANVPGAMAQVRELQKVFNFMQGPLISVPMHHRLQATSMCNWGDEIRRYERFGHTLMISYHNGALYKMYFHEGRIIETFQHDLCLPCQFGNQLPMPGN